MCPILRRRVLTLVYLPIYPSHRCCTVSNSVYAPCQIFTLNIHDQNCVPCPSTVHALSLPYSLDTISAFVRAHNRYFEAVLPAINHSVALPAIVVQCNLCQCLLPYETSAKYRDLLPTHLPSLPFFYDFTYFHPIALAFLCFSNTAASVNMLSSKTCCALWSQAFSTPTCLGYNLPCRIIPGIMPA